MPSPDRHPCPCCGYRTYLLPAGGTMQLCPVCFWEDATGDAEYNGSNQVSLIEAQRNFAEFGACERSYQDVVRTPLLGENRSPHWLTSDDLREKIITLIERAFQNVTRDGGATLHQMDLIDGGWPMTAEAMKDAEKRDPEVRWQDISATKLSEFHESLSFLDDLGFRFYLPAFMRHALRTSSVEIWRSEIDGVLWSLDSGPTRGYRSSSFALLQHEQKEAVAAFLYYFAIWGDCSQVPHARKGLKRGWEPYIPAFIKQAAL